MRVPCRKCICVATCAIRMDKWSITELLRRCETMDNYIHNSKITMKTYNQRLTAVRKYFKGLRNKLL
jgi:hypothetical protein